MGFLRRLKSVFVVEDYVPTTRDAVDCGKVLNVHHAKTESDITQIETTTGFYRVRGTIGSIDKTQPLIRRGNKLYIGINNIKAHEIL